MLGGALDFPTRGPHGTRGLLAGWGCLLVVAVLGFLLPLLVLLAVPVALFALLVRGYYFRTLVAVVGPEPTEPPRFGVRASLESGVKSLAVTVGYLLPVGLLVGAAVGSGAVTGPVVDPSVAPNVSRDAAGGLALLFGLLWAVGAWYLLPAAAARVADTGRLRDGFDLRAVVAVAGTEDYVVGWVLSVLLQAVTVTLGVALTPVLVGPFLLVFGGVATRYVYGRSYLAALGRATADG